MLDKKQSSNAPPRLGGLHHVAIQSKQREKLVQFYGDVLGLPKIREQPHSVWFDVGGIILMIEDCPVLEAPTTLDEAAIGTAPSQPKSASVHSQRWKTDRVGYHLCALRISADDKPAWRTHLQHAGVVIDMESQYTLYIFDPDGNRVGLSHYSA